MAFGQNYAPPGVYTRTIFENSVQGLVAGLRIPVLIGTGSEILTRSNLELVRGSSASVDQRRVQENMADRAVVSVTTAGAVTLGAFNGELRRVQVQHYPIVNGQGTGIVATKSSDVSVTVNGLPTVVTFINGAAGIVELAFAPNLGDNVEVTYFFKRTDTQVTDDLSAQVSATAAIVYGLVGETYQVVSGDNDVVVLTVDGVVVTATLPASNSTPWTAAQIAAFLNAAGSATSLVASTYTDNYGSVGVKLVADRDIVIGNGSANGTLGFVAGTSTARNRVFYAYNGPIVDGSNGGVTTTDPSNVVVKVNGVTVSAVAVDGQSRAITLPYAPAVGSTVTATYYFNTWQDTFDYVENIGILNVTQCGISPDRNDYTEGVDFALKDDKIVWGTASLISSGVHTDGAPYFGSGQVSAALVDIRSYLEQCANVVDTTVSPPVQSRTKFTLPLQPTTGNGRGSPLGSSLFQTVSNGRIDLPTNRPDLVFAYWGFGVQDALERGRVTVLAVDGSTITLKDAVPAGASVYATFYYNTLQDMVYTVTSSVPGVSGQGSYTVQNSSGEYLLTPKFGAKSAGLAAVTVNFPSGSERKPDCRFEAPFSTTAYEAPVEEDVTITFAATDSTPAVFTFANSGPYTTVDAGSDRLRLLVDGSALAGGAAGIDLSSPIAGVSALGFPASVVGAEIAYDADSGYTTYDVDATNNTLNLVVDGVVVTAVAATDTGVDLSAYVDAINTAADSAVPTYTSVGKFLSSFAVNSSEYDQLVFHYTGSASGASGSLTVTLDPATYSNASALATEIESQMSDAVDTLIGSSPEFTGLAVTVEADSSGRMVFGLASRATGTEAVGTLTVSGAPNAGDQVSVDGVVLTGVLGAPGALQFQVDGGTNELVAQSIIDALEAVSLVPDVVTATTNGSGVITFTAASVGDAGNSITLAVPTNVGGGLAVSGATLTGGNDADTSGYLEFLTAGTAARNFAVVAGIDTAASAGSGQVKLFSGPIAARYTVTGDNTGALSHDRVILRSRLIPGYGTVHPASILSSSVGVTVLGGTASTNVGLTPNTTVPAAWRGSVQPASLAGSAGWSGGQYTGGAVANATGQPLVTFYAAGGTVDANLTFKFTLDGVPVTVTFTDAVGAAIPTGGSADVPLGPGSSATTVIGQIRAAMTAAGLSSVSSRCVQEGAGFRLVSLLNTSSSSVVIGNGSANAVLGFSEGDTATRSLPTAADLASALMAHSSSTVAGSLLSWDSPTSTYFAAEALAFSTVDAAGASFLTIQSRGEPSLGTASSIALSTATAADALRQGSGLGSVSGQGSTGETGVSGFYVTSSDPSTGSGSVNTSLFNSGVGQDGVVGQTYRDLVTGLTFTILPRTGGGLYPTGESFTLVVRRAVLADSNVPTNVLPGVELTVSNTVGIPSGDTALVETLARGGEEPAVGDVYYVSYEYAKQDFQTQLFTNFKAIEAAYGPLSTDNPVTLAAYLSILNGAVLMGVKQVRKDEDNGTRASVTAYRDALDELEGPLPGGALPSILLPLRGDSLSLFQYAARHADIQSDLRHRAERTILAGFSAGTSPNTARQWAPQIGRTRFRAVYPDTVIIPLPANGGLSEEQVVVDGPFLAAQLLGSLVTTDVATPWTGRRLVGATRLARTLDRVTQDQVAVSGLTVLEDANGTLRVRQGFTTDMSSLQTKIPTIIQIVDETQQQSRATLERFIGTKFVPQVLSQIEGQLSTTLQGLVRAQILASYAGVVGRTSATDFTAAEVEATIVPVFPLLYIALTFSLTSRSQS